MIQIDATEDMLSRTALLLTAQDALATCPEVSDFQEVFKMTAELWAFEVDALDQATLSFGSVASVNTDKLCFFWGDRRLQKVQKMCVVLL